MWGGRRSLIAGLASKALNKICGKTRLVEMDSNGRRSDTPQKMNTEEPFKNTHKVHLAMFRKKTTEESFNLRIFGEVDKVVNVETKGEWRRCDDRQRIRGVTYESCTEIWDFK